MQLRYLACAGLRTQGIQRAAASSMVAEYSQRLRAVQRLHEAHLHNGKVGGPLPVDLTVALLRLQKLLPDAIVPDFTVRRTVVVMRRLLQAERAGLDSTMYTDLLRTVSVKGPQLQWGRDQVRLAFETILSAAAAEFSSNAVPLLERVLPLYVKACIGLNLHDGLQQAAAVLHGIPLPPEVFSEDRTPHEQQVAGAVEHLAVSMFLLAEEWNKKSFQRRKLRVITRHSGPKCVQKIRISQYHYKTLSQMQMLFNTLQKRIEASKNLLEEPWAGLVDSKEEVAVGCGRMLGSSRAEPSAILDKAVVPADAAPAPPPLPDASAWLDDEPLRVPKYKRLFRRKPRLPKLCDVQPSLEEQQQQGALQELRKKFLEK